MSATPSPNPHSVGLHRLVPVRLWTAAGWVSGTVHVPTAQLFVDYFQHAHAFLPLTDVTIFERRPLPFFAVQRASILLALVDETGPLEVTMFTRPAADHQVVALFQNAVVRGRMKAPHDVRLSDHLTRQGERLVVLEDTLIEFAEPSTQPGVPVQHQRVLVNPKSLIGISELPPESTLGG